MSFFLNKCIFSLDLTSGITSVSMLLLYSWIHISAIIILKIPDFPKGFNTLFPVLFTFSSIFVTWLVSNKEAFHVVSQRSPMGSSPSWPFEFSLAHTVLRFFFYLIYIPIPYWYNL